MTQFKPSGSGGGACVDDGCGIDGEDEGGSCDVDGDGDDENETGVEDAEGENAGAPAHSSDAKFAKIPCQQPTPAASE